MNKTINWKVVSARLVTLAGLFCAGGELAGLVPSRYAAPVYAVAGLIVSLLPRITKPAGIIRPAGAEASALLRPLVQSVTALVTAPATSRRARADALVQQAVALALQDPDTIAGLALQLTGQYTRTPQGLAPTLGTAGADPVPAVLSPSVSAPSERTPQ